MTLREAQDMAQETANRLQRPMTLLSDMYFEPIIFAIIDDAQLPYYQATHYRRVARFLPGDDASDDYETDQNYRAEEWAKAQGR